MKIQTKLGTVLSIAAISCGCAFAQTGKTKTDVPALTQTSVKPFLGRWDITAKTPKGEAPSWLELSEQNGELKALMVGRWGGVCPPKVDVRMGVLTFASPKEGDCDTNLVFNGKLEHGKLTGSATGPHGNPWTWVGVHAPAMDRTAAPKWGAPIALFNGKNLAGWHEFTAGNFPVARHWTVFNGTLVSPGNGPELATDRKFGDFKLHLEFKLGPDSNSGVYLRGRYELQIENESASEPPSHHTGGIYGFLAPHPELPRTTDKWQTYDITLIGRRVTVVQNGTTVIDNKVIPGITGGAVNSDEAAPGPIYLQGSEKGHVSFRNIVITPAE
ncbi:MAG: 3-keto-disaccharide hydrolase [Acidobacteriaceae bacterium]